MNANIAASNITGYFRVLLMAINIEMNACIGYRYIYLLRVGSPWIGLI